ncbi:MAG: SMC family ATPase [Meiothermus sp.]|nr:SMC family ATPase [Meiothermus sp.]
MRPLKLRIEGFGAYQESVEVGFDDVELFAITGQTGAGKSTLLDAITYALYKATPRIGSTGFRELKHPAAEMARVELTFAVGEQSWRVVRVVGKENQNRLEYLAGGEWRSHAASEKVASLDKKLSDVVGMDYETFTRAILLPQGQFDLFLRGSPRERRDTLIKLYGLESLRVMREKTRERLEGFRERSAELQGELGALAEAEEGKISDLREGIERLGREEQGLALRAEAAQKTLGELETRFARFGELENLRRRRGRWEAERAEVAKISERLRLAERAERVWPQLESLEKAAQESASAQQELNRAQSEDRRLAAELDRAREGFDPGALDALRFELAQLPELERLEARLKRYGGGLETRHPQPLPFDEDRLDALRDAERLFGEADKAAQRARRAELNFKKAVEDEKEEQRRFEALSAQLEAIKAAGIRDKEALEQARAELEAERLHQGIAQFHGSLKAGEICPLCGQTVATVPPPQALADVQAMQAEVARREGALSESRADYKAKTDLLKDLKERLPRLLEQIQTQQDEDQRAREDLEALRARTASLGTPEQATDERLRRLAGLAEVIRKATAGQPVRAYGDGLQARLKQSEARARTIADLEAGLTESRRQVERLSDRAKDRQGFKEGLEASVTVLLSEAQFDSAQSVRAARRSPQEVAALQAKQTQHEHEGIEIASELKRLEAELGSQDPVTEAAVREARETLASLKHSVAAHKEQIGRTKADLERLQAQLVRKREVLKKKAELDQKTDLWEQLFADLKGDRFQDFLLERYQSGLLGRASELIKTLSQNRYTLRLDDGEYKVLDRWNDALRPVRTLSGGESFMASLSLALSLSEHLSRGRIGALFLDEGFGTLDAETLEQVAGVLEALPTQGRLVGIVTHVEALAERLPARLLVEKSPAGSKVSWRD